MLYKISQMRFQKEKSKFDVITKCMLFSLWFWVISKGNLKVTAKIWMKGHEIGHSNIIKAYKFYSQWAVGHFNNSDLLLTV